VAPATLAPPFGHELRIDLTVQPGEQNQTVTVHRIRPAGRDPRMPPWVGHSKARKLSILPLNGRDLPITCLGLRPGVMLQPGGGTLDPKHQRRCVRMSPCGSSKVCSTQTSFDARPSSICRVPFTDGATIPARGCDSGIQSHGKSEGGIMAGRPARL